MTDALKHRTAWATVAFLLLAGAGRSTADDREDVVPCCAGAAPAEAGRPRPDGERRVLRVAADPNNLPFSNERREGFENRIAELIARELDVEIEYEWRAQRRGFFRQTLKEGDVDLILGVPARFEMALTTKPYYRSTYVFVSRKDRNLDVRSFDDPVLRKLRVGVQLVGDDGTNTPPAHALAARGVVGNLVGYMVYGNYAEESPPARIVEAVAKREIDLAVVWGPLAGYHAKRQEAELVLTPVPPKDERTGLPFAFAISLGVRKDNKELRDRMDGILERNRTEIEAILEEYGMPQVPADSVPALADDDDDDGPPGRPGGKP